MQPSAAWQHNVEKIAILPTGCAQKTAQYSLNMLLPLRFFNKHHTIQLPELFIEIH